MRLIGVSGKEADLCEARAALFDQIPRRNLQARLGDQPGQAQPLISQAALQRSGGQSCTIRNLVESPAPQRVGRKAMT